MASERSVAGRQRRRVVLGDEVFFILGQAIRDGELPPGQLLRDVDLATRFGVSRTPVREALQRLERIGLVEIEANRYTRVAALTPKVVRDTRAFIVGLSVEAFHLALPSCSSETLASIVEALDGMIATPLADRAAHTRAASAFFRTLSMASGNIVLGRFARESALALERNLQGWAFLPADAAFRDAFRAGILIRDVVVVERMLRAIDIDAA